MDWALVVPQGGKAVIEGTLSASIPKGVMPKDEQDEEDILVKNKMDYSKLALPALRELISKNGLLKSFFFSCSSLICVWIGCTLCPN